MNRSSISPNQMAQIYMNRAGKYAFKEISILLANFKQSSVTTQYWQQVLREIQLTYMVKEGQRTENG